MFDLASFAFTSNDPSVTPENFLDFGIHLVVDLAAVLVLAFGIYLRHGRRDIVTCLLCFNLALFVVLAVIDVRSVDLGFGFGLFALLSIISLRSETFSTIELAYFFCGIVLGVVNALEVGGTVLNWSNELFAILLSATIVLGVYLVDHPRLRPAAGHVQITLDTVHRDPVMLRNDLEDRLGVDVTTATVLHADYVQDTMLVDVRYVAPDGARGQVAGVATLDQP
ncbi:DUF4956 domain-containing protein [Mobilicoccus massiliensis]|uniref:DUF4956 domain-containing protein n=1 Tax=Mobilicoccus massiliensis TaxID=1522310 RepID=UPI000694D6F3|nr:DUF4956 domain-containing protein [Mobilicoccus massiliensis]